MNRDLTEGNPQKVLWAFCLPLLGSMVFQQLYNIADSLIAGKFIGENALAAVGNSYEITLIFIAFAFGCNVGCSVIVSRLFGAKKYNDVKTAIFTTWITGAVLVAVLMICGLAFSPALLRMIKTPAEVMADSELYLRIYIYGLAFLFFYNISTGIFSALGDSRTPFIFLAISSTANIFVDALFVAKFHMGVAGVAWATFLCQGISCIAANITVLKRLKQLVPHEKDEGKVKLFSVEIFKSIVIVAVPSILQQSFISVGNIVIQGVINGYGPAVMAGYSAAVKLNNLVITSFTTLANGVSNFASQNLGAGKTHRIADGFKAGLKMVYVICIPIVILYFIFGGSLVGFFMKDGSAEAIDSGFMFLKVLAPFYFVVSTKLVSDGILRGVSAMKDFMIATFTDLILRVVLAKVLSDMLQASVGIWLAWPVGWIISTIMSVIFYRKWIKKYTELLSGKNTKPQIEKA